MIHEPSPFLKRGNKLQSICLSTLRFDSIRRKLSLICTNTPKLSRVVWGNLRFDLTRTESICTTGSQDPWNNDTWTLLVLKTWQQTSVDSSEALYNSTRFAGSRSALPPEVKIHEVIIHEPSSFLKHDTKLQSIRLWHSTTRLNPHAVEPHYWKSRSVK